MSSSHPKYVKAIKGKNTDRRDAKWIANLFRFDIVKASIIPPADIRALRELSRYRLKLFIFSEIGTDMSVFESDRHLCSRAGLTPANNEECMATKVANKKNQPDAPGRDNI